MSIATAVSNNHLRIVIYKGVMMFVTYNYFPTVPATYDSYGVPLTPPEPECVEIEAIIIGTEDCTDLLSPLFTEIEKETLKCHNPE